MNNDAIVIIPEGEHKVEVHSWDTVNSSLFPKKYVILRLCLTDGRTLIYNIHSLGELNKVLEACNKSLVDKHNDEEIKRALDSLTGWKFIATVIHIKRDDNSILVRVKKLA